MLEAVSRGEVLSADLPDAVRSTGVDPVEVKVDVIEDGVRECVGELLGVVDGTVGIVVPAARRAEVARCRPWLTRQVELVDPRVVVALGSTAAAWFFGPSARIGALRQRGLAEPLTYDGRALLVTYHPSAAIRFGPNGEPLAALRTDLSRDAALLAAPS